ncbi:hypothetical protein PsB1_0790 [Candidatus Phycosocius spiralis]|uniref:Uncharacterized protein n=1 Tax=Candidatus Phycosocius spiralis TaxID=2815099 RepID=A0ABQ4PUJ2_9PROT|nr:hypothetical protein PsB1_0790 [Candidatus Phycosocius spiralis]
MNESVHRAEYENMIGKTFMKVPVLSSCCAKLAIEGLKHLFLPIQGKLLAWVHGYFFVLTADLFSV